MLWRAQGSVCWSCCPSISNALPPFQWGACAHLYWGFILLQPGAKGQPSIAVAVYFGFFGTSEVVSKRLCPLPIFCYPVHCLPHRLYNLVEDEPVGRRGVLYNTVLYDPNRPTHTGAGRGATNSIQLTINTTHVTINTCEYITSHRELSRVCYFACHTLPRALLGIWDVMFEIDGVVQAFKEKASVYHDRKTQVKNTVGTSPWNYA